MRLVQATIPTGKREAIRRALEDEGVDYVFTDETSGRTYAAIAYFPLPANAVEPVLESLRRAGLDEDAYTIVIDANTVISRQFDELVDEYAEEASEDRISREELRTAAAELMPTNRDYVVLVMISAIVATAGLLLDSAAVVVGSMVIAPLVGPALATSVGTVIDEPGLRTRGVALQALGILAAVGAAAGFSAFVQIVNVVPANVSVLEIGQVRERLAPDFLALAIALGAGVAGALSLSTGVSAALVGVMIAVALIPPAAVVGIGLAWNEPLLALGSAVLVLVNVLSINLAALAVLWYQGYRPDKWFRKPDVRQLTLTRIGVLAAVIVLLSVFLGGVTYAGYQESVAEQAIGEETRGLAGEYEELSLLEIQIESDQHPLRGHPERVVVTFGTPPGVEAPVVVADENRLLVDVLEQRIADRLGGPVEVELRLVTIQRSTGSENAVGSTGVPAGAASGDARSPSRVRAGVASEHATAAVPARHSSKGSSGS